LKFSLAQQIEEVQRELGLRENVYARLVIKGEMRQAVADYHLERMQAALKSLKWLQRHETKIKTAVGGAR
jgi:hypothetical protein